MAQTQNDDTLHQRFFQLAGLIRHEYWLHQEHPEDHGFLADPDTLTIRARKQGDPGTVCVLEVTERMLAGDLYALATEFYKSLCGGVGHLAQPGRPSPPRAKRSRRITG